MSFVSYILQFDTHDSKYGDVARDFRADPEIRLQWGYPAVQRHLANHNACQRVFELVDELYFEYSFFTLSE